MNSFPWFWIFFGMFFWMFFMRPRRLWACHRGGSPQLRDSIDPTRRANRVDLESALADRDALIAKLEERVRVLERIATDDAARLRDEIDALRDKPQPGSSG
jgi:hypothetical protein